MEVCLSYGVDFSMQDVSQDYSNFALTFDLILLSQFLWFFSLKCQFKGQIINVKLILGQALFYTVTKTLGTYSRFPNKCTSTFMNF